MCGKPKACNDWLPMQSNLVKRGMVVERWCPFCFNNLETVFHSLWNCHVLKVVRRRFPKIKGMSISENISFLELMISCRNQLCLVVWRTWYRRNAKIYSSANVFIKDIVPLAESFLDDFRRVNSNCDDGPGSPSGDEMIIPSWRPPDSGLFRLNTNAAIDGTMNRVGTGAIIRNSDGMVMPSCVQVLSVSYSPLMAEALAILWGIRFVRDSGRWPCQIESDSQVVVSLVNSVKVPVADIGLIISDIVKLMDTSPRCVLNFIPRKANMAAHCLAKLGLNCGLYGYAFGMAGTGGDKMFK
ncbi:hypothetical protein Dsin_016640 [Dipteronia sinensis]|uniref:RNase H type-1 domain-containing protein n=1 Tax=Dipteronia sinensis TaxID=43782 RepID=A0AAE0ADQ9_9ROSI|nr:hypothetical protein Dsin_016640 [Dipteronia sinensis]